MGIVRFALRFPHTFYVVAALVLFLGVVASIKMPTDIFPEINIPVVTVVWSYTGLSTAGNGAARHHLQPVRRSAPTSAASGTSRRRRWPACRCRRSTSSRTSISTSRSPRSSQQPMPSVRCCRRAFRPPLVVQFNASSVPVLQISLSSDTLSEQQLYDYGIYRIRQQLAPIPGITLPTPAGGKYRQIMVDLDPVKAARQGAYAARRGECRQCAEPDAARRHGEVWPHAIRRPHQRHAGFDRRPQQHSDQGCQWRDHLRQGRRPGSRWLAGAAERGAAERPALRVAQYHQERKCLDASSVVNAVHEALQDGTRRGASGHADQRSCSISRCSSSKSVEPACCAKARSRPL